MVYDVTYQVGSEERTDRVIAPDAADAAERVSTTYGGGEDHFELLSVVLLENPEEEAEPVAATA